MTQRLLPPARRRLTATAVAVVLALAPLPQLEPVQAQALPDLGDAAQTNFSAVQEKRLGETIIRQLRANGAYIDDPEVNDYLQELGHRLVAASKDVKQDFEFFGVPDPQVNAFALPGGYVGVHTGLILLTQTESELAAVLAHEITHVTQHHMARALAAQKDSMLMSLAGLALAILAARGGGSSSGDTASAAIAATQALTIQNQLNFPRENEYEADRLGVQRLDAGGFDVTAMATFMERMQRAFRFVEGNAPTYLRTHPITYERIAEAQARALSAQKDSMLMSLAGLALAILAARGGGSSSGETASAAIAATQALTIQNQLNFTRENEYEADRIGFQRLDEGGFDVTAMATFMERMQRAFRFVEGNAPTYLRTHPITYERIAEAQARAQGHPYRQVTSSLDFHLVRALLRSYQGDPKETVAFFDDSLAQHKYNNEIATHYGLVASLLRQKDWARAKQELATLERMTPEHPMIDAMAGHVLLDSGDVQGAIQRFEAAVARYPNKMQLVYDYPEALLQAGRNADAARFVERQLGRFPDDGPLQLLAARAYAAQDKQMLAHRHQGEYYAWQGNLKGAIEQFEIASKQKDGDFYQASVVDTRLKALKKEVADQGKSAFGNSG